MRLLICGDRKWTNSQLIEDLFWYLRPDMLIAGGANGADSTAAITAVRLQVPHTIFPAQWGKHGKSAGPIRNQQMIDEGKPDLIVAFHNHIEQSAGTADMLMKAERQRIPYALVEEIV